MGKDTHALSRPAERVALEVLAGNKGVERISFDAALKTSTTHAEDFVTAYVDDLANVIDLNVIRSASR